MIYLAHSFDKKEEIRNLQMKWNKQFNLNFFNPLCDGKYSKYTERAEVPTDVVMYDIQKIDDCTTLIAFIGKEITIGTTMEIVYAYNFDKQVIVCATEDNVSNLLNHAWIRHHANAIWSLDVLENCFKHGYNPDNPETKLPDQEDFRWLQ